MTPELNAIVRVKNGDKGFLVGTVARIEPDMKYYIQIGKRETLLCCKLTELFESPPVVITTIPSDADLEKAYELKTHEAYNSMKIAHSLHNDEPSIPWQLAMGFAAIELKAEIDRRKAKTL